MSQGDNCDPLCTLIKSGKIMRRLINSICIYHKIGPYDVDYLKIAEKEIDLLIGVASDWLGEYEMEALLTMYKYPSYIPWEVEGMNLTEEALYLCLN